MKINKVGSRGYMFTFYELKNTEFDCTTNVYLINGNNYIFICDTFLGPECMYKVEQFIKKYLKEKPIIVFNSHSDWDHIWGNCYFKDNIIIAHENCRKDIIRFGEYEFCKYREFKQGKVEIYPPNLVFKDRITFVDEGIEFFFSPGHTNNSASCIDVFDNIIFVGDNVESPKPYLNYNNLKQYENTLNEYLNIKPDTIIPGHGSIANTNLIKSNLEYIKKCANRS
ncbi:MBL fold metallo-hydrolase [Clostridium aestuarii]|uniref:MBL fold metallo-hydrolase n=1 Tax=Clostridium aestuarii TaxID=338193 RepID=A0ABT4CYK2_9CLOT|nr:MBL fold metallo-hydrolase [Clostridium aestuarii]MCY6484054.1 MBL fold metallo-hydrolase [Clostridium aestuarii]